MRIPLPVLNLLLLEYEQSKKKYSDIPQDGQRHLQLTHLVLDAEGMIESFSMSVPSAVGYPAIRLARRIKAIMITFSVGYMLF